MCGCGHGCCRYGCSSSCNHFGICTAKLQMNQTKVKILKLIKPLSLNKIQHQN